MGAAVVAATMALGAGVAQAAVGDLSHQGCISGSEDVVPPCVATSGSTPDGFNSGLAGLGSVEVSPDGQSVYGLSRADDSIAHFRRDPNGALTYAGCITGEDESKDACTAIPGAPPNGVNGGLNSPRDIVVSGDGRDVYLVTSGDDSLAHFSRNQLNGNLSYEGCISSNADTDPACTQIAGATAGGTLTGMDLPLAVEISADGSSIYAASNGGSVNHFSRQAGGGLAFVGCLSGNSLTPCAKTPGHAPSASETGLDATTYMAISPDGESLYTVSDSDESVVEFSLDPVTGAPTYERCLSGATSITNCTPIPGATPTGATTGLRSIQHVSISPDSRSLYTANDDGDAVTHFSRGSSGALTFAGCLSGDTSTTGCTILPHATPSGEDSGMDPGAWVEPSPDGHSVYYLSSQDDAIALFARDPATGALSYGGCLTAETESSPPCDSIPGATSFGLGSGMNASSIGSLAADPGGRSLYAGAGGSDDSLTRFDREPDTTAPSTEITAGPAPGALLNVNEAGFEFNSAAGDLAGFECETTAAAPAAFAPCTSPLVISGLSQGEHSFSVRAFDLGGNVESPPLVRSFTVDTIAPRLRIAGKKLRLNRNRKVRVKLRCPASERSGPCRGKVKLKTRKKVRLLRRAGVAAKRKQVVLAKKSYRVASGKAKKVKLRLSQRKARTVRKQRKARKIRRIANVRDAAGNKRKVTRKGQLKPKKRKKKR